jgi:hypothetical protein
MNAAGREALWGRLQAAALVDGAMPAHGEARSPWFVRVMLGFAGWIGALFLLGFVGAGLAFIVKNSTTAYIVGAGACAVAAMIFRADRKGEFFSQFGLAVALAGQVLMAWGMTDMLKRSFTGIALGFAVQQAILFLLLPNFVHRVWAAWTAVYALAFAMVDMGLHPYAPAVVTAVFIAVWLQEFEHPEKGEMLRAGGYGLALAALFTAVLHGALWYNWVAAVAGSKAAGSVVQAWAGAIASGAVLIGAVILLLRREDVPLGSGPGKIALAVAGVLALASLKAPGIGPATAILVVGYANGNRVLAGLGIAALVGYLSHYYYALHTTLLEKSILMGCAGLVLLVARLAVHRWWPLQGEVKNA